MRFDEDTGLNLGLRQRGGHDRSGIAVKVGNAGEGGRSVDGAGGRGSEEGGRGGGQGEQTVVFEVPPELHSQVKTGSVLLAINNIPVRILARGGAGRGGGHQHLLAPRSFG